MGTGNGNRPAPGRQFQGIVRWESAEPIIDATKADATKAALADAFANHYVIGVSGFPLGDAISVSGLPTLSDRAMEQIVTASSLTPKGKPMAKARVAQVVVGGVRLGFSQESIQISRGDEEVAFATVINRMTIKAKFNLKEMMYRGTLAV